MHQADVPPVFLRRCKPSTAFPLTSTVNFNVLMKMQGMPHIVLRMSVFTYRLVHHAFYFNFGEFQLISWKVFTQSLIKKS